MEPEIFPNMSTKQVLFLKEILLSHLDIYEDARENPIFSAMLDEIKAKSNEITQDKYLNQSV